MALISAGKSNGILDPRGFLSSLFLSRIVKWSFWLVPKLNAAENHRGMLADGYRCMYCCQAIAISPSGICGVTRMYFETRTCSIFWGREMPFPVLLVYLGLLPWCVWRRGFWLNVHSLAKIQACWKTWT